MVFKTKRYTMTDYTTSLNTDTLRTLHAILQDLTDITNQEIKFFQELSDMHMNKLQEKLDFLEDEILKEEK